MDFEILDENSTLLEIGDFLYGNTIDKPIREIDALFAQLKSHKHDVIYWLNLKDLTIRLDSSQFNAAALQKCSSIGNPTIETLIEDLRQSLPAATDPISIEHWFEHSVNAKTTALVGFLLLATAIASFPVKNELNEHKHNQMFHGLLQILENTSISTWAQNEILFCLPQLDSHFRHMEFFEMISNPQIAYI